MAEIEPFRAIRYSQSDLSDLVAPPYDVLTLGDKNALLAKNEQNIVAIDLPHVPPKSAGPDELYERAAGELVSWLDTHHLMRDLKPAIYVYHQTYQTVSQTLTRRMFFSRLRLEPLGKGRVFAHEQTFGGPKEDRLKLMVATRCQLSPIFALYPDAENSVSALFDETIESEPDASAMLDGVLNRLWIVTDRHVIEDAQARMADRPIYIADGHHRYSTALNYRERQIEELGEEPGADDPIHFVLTVMAGMEDPGVTILPYYRALVELPGLTSKALMSALSGEFDASPMRKPKNESELAKLYATAGEGSLVFQFGKEDAAILLTPRNPDLLSRLEPKRHPAWRRLAYSIFHRYIVDEVIQPRLNGGKPPTIHYHKSMRDAVDDAQNHNGVAVLPPATTMTQLREICAAGELMPQKSTYFHPKLVTGLVINPLYD